MTPHGEPVGRRLVPDPLQRAPRAVRVHAARRGASAGTGRSSSRPPTPTRPRGPARRAHGRHGRVALAASCCSGSLSVEPSPSRPTGFSSVPALDLRGRARASCRTCASSASATSTSRRCSRPASGSTHGYDVVDPRRVSEELGGERGAAGALRGRARRRPRRRPEPHGDATTRTRSGATRSCASSSSTSTRDRAAPALLRHRRARRRPRRGPGGVRDDARLVLDLVARGPRRRPADRPPRRARRPPRLPRAAARRGRRAGLGREDPRARRAAARLAGRRHDGLRLPERRPGALRRPGRRGRADRARGRAATVRTSSPLEAKLEQARTTFQPEVERLRRLLDVPDLERALALAARLPHVRRAVERPRRGGRPRGARRRCPTTLAPRAPARGARPRRVRHALPADDRAR